MQQLSARYDKPTADLDQSTAQQLFGESVPNYTELKTLAGLSFVRGVIARALKTSPVDDTALDLDVQGSLAIHAACPGWEGKTATPDPEAGYVDFVVGVDDSRVQRAFAGSVTECRFVASLGGQRAKVQASMQLEVDLGHSLALGDPVPAVLLSASQLSAALSVPLSPALADGLWGVLAAELAPDGLDLGLDTASRRVSLRVAGEDLVETLVDLDALDVGTNGTVLLGLRDDGSFNLRGRDSAWNCGSDGSTVCVRSD
ncbi:MAG TPA: hypothetical protein VFN67_01490 [Polyangiales bacterium]|nr:hypothetical protein [Polyangiales bacterium]